MKRYSLLTRKEEAKSIRRAVFFGFLTIVLTLGIIIGGIPALIKIAVFLGNLRASSTPIESKDILPPSSPILAPLPSATNSAQINLSGYAEPASTINIFIDGSEIKKVVVGKDGFFTTENILLAIGDNEIYAISIDEAGNKSTPSEKMTIKYKNIPPELEVIQPKDKTAFWDNNRVEIIGKTDPEVKVLINDHLVIIDKEGNFKYYVTLTVGENNFKILATDNAGNQTEKSLALNFSP